MYSTEYNIVVFITHIQTRYLQVVVERHDAPEHQDDQEAADQIQAIATFQNSICANEALVRIDGKFEFDEGCILHAEFMEDVDDRSPEASIARTLRARASEYPQHQLTFSPASRQPPPPPHPLHDHRHHHARPPPPQPPSPPFLPITTAGMLIHQPTHVTYQTHGTSPIAPSMISYAPAFHLAAVASSSPHRMYAPIKNERDNLPCNTLFIGNLGEHVEESELQSVYGNQPGFQQLKVVKSPKGISAFVEFVDVLAARACHDAQQGLILSSSDRGPIRVQYSKNPFGHKGDVLPATSSSTSTSGSISPTLSPHHQIAQGYPVAVPQPILSGLTTPATVYGMDSIY